MIWAAIKADASKLWRALTRDAVAELRAENAELRAGISKLAADCYDAEESLKNLYSALNDRIVALEIERAAAPPAEPEPDPATSWQRARARAEHG